MQQVSGSCIWEASCVKEALVSPRPWRRMRMLVGASLDGAGYFGGKG